MFCLPKTAWPPTCGGLVGATRQARTSSRSAVFLGAFTGADAETSQARSREHAEGRPRGQGHERTGREGVPGGGERENLEEEKPRRGASIAAGNTVEVATDSRTDEGPEGGAGGAGVEPRKRGDRRDRPTPRGQRPATSWRGCARGETPEGQESWTRQRGETNPPSRCRSKTSRACETPGTDGDEVGSSSQADAGRSREEGAANPMGGGPGLAGPGTGADGRNSGEEASAREDEPDRQRSGDGAG